MPYLEYQTYYRILQPDHPTHSKTPIVLLHGGPGSTHNYFELLDDLALNNRPVIMYDQLGCGKSFVENRPDLWKAETWINELIALRHHLNLDSIHLLGQSWGGMLAIQYMCDYQPKGIQSLILSSTLPAAIMWKEETHRLIRLMDEKDQLAIQQAETSENFTEPNYLKANERFMIRHAADLPSDNSPEPLRRKKQSGAASYLTAWGPNEYNPTGTLAHWDYRNQLDKIKVPTLITSGTDDLCTPLIAKTMYDLIPDASWDLFPKSRHMPFVDENRAYLSQLNKWLDEHE